VAVRFHVEHADVERWERTVLAMKAAEGKRLMYRESSEHNEGYSRISDYRDSCLCYYSGVSLVAILLRKLRRCLARDQICPGTSGEPSE